MARWNSTQHSIGDLRDWAALEKLEIMPDYQRREVWSDAARVMLIDTVLQGLPMPKFYVRRTVNEESTHRQVIDGQQRVRALLDFLSGKLALGPPCSKELHGKRFNDLSSEQKDAFLTYLLDINELTGPSDEETRQVYCRVNKYMKQLNRQELRRADYPGAFLDVAERLSLHDLLDDFAVFTPANRRRMGDVEYTSELLAFLINGKPLDRKTRLDWFYQEYSSWDDNHQSETEREFNEVLDDIALLFSGDTPDQAMPKLRSTRFNQKADFYSLFAAVSHIKREGGALEGKDLSHLRADILTLDSNIGPSSDIELLRLYAIRCVSDANSASNRWWRARLFKAVLNGTYLASFDVQSSAVLAHMAFDLVQGDRLGLCPVPPCYCPISNAEFEATPETSWVAWKLGDAVQLSNAEFISKSHVNRASLKDWHLAPEEEPGLLVEARRA